MEKMESTASVKRKVGRPMKGTQHYSYTLEEVNALLVRYRTMDKVNKKLGWTRCTQLIYFKKQGWKLISMHNSIVVKQGLSKAEMDILTGGN